MQILHNPIAFPSPGGWLATSLIAAITVQLLLSWDWIVQITRRFPGKMNNQARFNYILNWLLFIDGTVIMLS